MRCGGFSQGRESRVRLTLPTTALMDRQCWPGSLHLVSGGENMSWLPLLHFPFCKHLNDLNVLSVPGIALEDGDSVKEEDKHRGFLREGGGGDRTGPWLSLYKDMFWLMTNLKGTEQEQGPGAQRDGTAG